MHSVLETSIFTRRADALLSQEERADLVNTLSADPKAGALVPGLGGIRKLRFAPEGQGKSGAFRVIYYLLDDKTPRLLSGSGVVAGTSCDQARDEGAE